MAGVDPNFANTETYSLDGIFGSASSHSGASNMLRIIGNSIVGGHIAFGQVMTDVSIEIDSGKISTDGLLPMHLPLKKRAMPERVFVRQAVLIIPEIFTRCFLLIPRHALASVACFLFFIVSVNLLGSCFLRSTPFLATSDAYPVSEKGKVS